MTGGCEPEPKHEEQRSTGELSARPAKGKAVQKIVIFSQHSSNIKFLFIFCGFQATHFQQFGIYYIQVQNIDDEKKDPLYVLPKHHRNHHHHK